MSSIANLINLSMGFESEEVVDQNLDQMTEEELDNQLEAQENALDVGENNAQAEMAKDASSAVSSIQESVESFKSSDIRHSDKTAKYVQFAVNRGYSIVGSNNQPALESFQNNAALALESLSNELSSAVSQLNDFRLKKLEKVSDILSTNPKWSFESEDGEVVDDTAPSDIDGVTLHEKSVVTDASNQEEKISDIENTVQDASVIVNEFDKDVANGEVDEDVVKAADFAVESLTWGFSGVKPIKISDYYRNGHFDKKGFSHSMENDFKPMLEVYFKKWTANFYRAYGYLVTRSLVHRARLNLLIKKASKKEGGDQGGKTIHVNMKYLHKEGKVPTHLARYIQDYAVWTRPVIETFHENAKQAFKANALTLNKINDGNGSIQELMSSWQDPRKALKDPAFPVPGGRLLFSNVERKVSPTTKEGKFFASVAYENYPTIIMYRKFSDLGKEDIPAMSAADIVKTSQEIQRSIAGINKFQSIVNSVAASHKASLPTTFPTTQGLLTIGIVMMRRFYPTIQEADDTARAVNDAMKVSRRMCFNVAYDAASTLLTVSSGWIKAAKASL